MMIIKPLSLFVGLLFMLAISQVLAAPTWKIISADSTINFTGTQNNAPVTGKFKNFNGDFRFAPDQLNASHVKIIVDINSITTSYSDLTTALKSSDWFDVAKFPQAIFIADKFEKIDDNSYQADGMLTIRDKTKPVSIKFIVTNYSPDKLQITGSTTIKRSDFDVGKGEWAGFDTVKNEVIIAFNLTGKI